MALPKFLQLCILFFAMVWSTNACVDFTAYLNEETDSSDGGTFVAQVKDGGEYVCNIYVTYDVGGYWDLSGTFGLSECLSGYTVDITWFAQDDGIPGITVSYARPGFSGTFGTTVTQNPDDFYTYTASVWDC